MQRDGANFFWASFKRKIDARFREHEVRRADGAALEYSRRRTDSGPRGCRVELELSSRRLVGPDATSTNLMIRRCGADAKIEAVKRADELLEFGDIEGCAAWKRIIEAIHDLQSTEKTPDTATH